MDKNAVYADKLIPLLFGSLTSHNFQTFHCVECGAEILIRNNSHIIRLGAQNAPEVAHIGADGTIPVTCHQCSQKYSILANPNVVLSEVELHTQPQTVFITLEYTKQLRDIHCVECGKKFFSISDRISLISDNTPPVSIQDPDKIGSMESWCKNNHCKQRWTIMT